jgi:hypothetical protein
MGIAAAPVKTLPHLCHVPGCNVPVPRRLLMCGPHWRRVPRALQAAVWRQYRAGQEQGGAPVTRDYLAAARAACDAVASP